MRAHLLGVAGAGMAPLAGLLVAAGVEVSGSDVAFDPPMGPRLAKWGVRTCVGVDAAHLDGLDAHNDVVVVGNVCRRDHPLVLEAERRGLRCISMPTALRELVFVANGGATRPIIAIAGTHGKTTSTAMVATILSAVGLDPGYLVGGVPQRAIDAKGSAKNGTVGDGEPFAIGRRSRSLLELHAATGGLAPFVIEGDEYDSAFFEKQPKVWGYQPRAAILTSLEHDHVDIYADEKSYRDAFAGLLDRLPSESDGGLLVANAGDPAVVSLIAETRPRCRVVTYAASDVSGLVFPSGSAHGDAPTWTAATVGLNGEGDRVQPYDLFIGPSSAGRFALSVFGAHNVSNAVAAIAICAELLHVPVREAALAVAAFSGVKRRQERLVDGARSSRGAFLYDDFAHHPTAVDATLHSMRARHVRSSLIAVYEPRSATACRAMHQAAYAESFAVADVVVLAPLGRSTIPAAERLDLTRLAHDLESTGKQVVLCASTDEVVSIVDRLAERGSAVVCMSNGAFGGVTAQLAERLA